MKFIQPARVVIAGIAAASVVVATHGTASASSVPFTDPNANGYVGLCNESGQPITSGSTLDDPFVWTALSSTPAPAGYAHGRATLYVFQPRQNVPPGEWSGQQVTGSSSYTNPNHPMAQATSGDAPLISVDGAFPPQWNGLYQLRMYFTGVNLEPNTQSYPATVIRVSGEKWSVVQGGRVACNSGKAFSSEVSSLNKPSLQTPQSVIVTPGTVRGATSGLSSSSGQGGAGGTQSPSQGGSSKGPGQSDGSNALPATEPVGAAGKGGGMSGGTIAAMALISAAVLAGGGAGLTLWRRRNTPRRPGGRPVPAGQ